ncbi:MAG: T9SS type A sorting domain-containing protein [Candidatus Marinimicrobia bacterium]|nr:T9SS type A sorting domain-containing protein [Candidatus Neomarinimicrobiota bacterium]
MKSYIFIFLIFISEFSTAQIGEIIWEENFDNLDNWLIETGNGSWGWGNGELQYYSENNVEISEIPNEPGNNGLHIIGKEESGSNILDQWGNSLNYTSGKITSKSKISAQYGMIETRVMVPDIDLGGWPAVWMLGTANYNWPRCGELDLMEMGHTQVFRDLHDDHNGGNGNNNSTVNQMVGANAIFYADEAVNEGNPSGAASISWDPDDDYCRPYYNYDNLNNRFLTYRIYWDPDSIRFTIIDDGSEYDFYNDIFPIDSVSDEFNAPFFFNINLAIGGTLTDAYNLGDPGSGLPISLPLPTSMYVDYIQIREWNGHGNVHIGPPEFEGGTYGLFTDTTPVDNGLIPGENAEIYVWEGTLSEGSIPSFEGENGITWTSTGSGWFGAGIMSIQPVNLFNFGDGYLKFRIKIPSNVSFQIGIIDAWGNQSYVEFPSGQTRYGLVRDGEWGQASIPIDDIRGDYIDLRMLSYEFVILEVNGASCEFALDDIYWEGGGTVDVANENKDLISQKFILYDNYPNPFNPVTTLLYDLPENSLVNITIYDMMGREVKTLVNQAQDAGYRSIIWDATNDYGKPVSAGIYLYQIQAGEYISTKKMVLLK